ncbi:uncharacterized protein EI90DRAFT_3123948 [Cantharellus anzutake]|uniref:uncharacterized protein n=1 Tax=Cantharellus anzutake TaxID=1750568 RepID=UPI0019046EDC|nr:uncharacterized protein EI90DRAFT_3123948 [Cantharellus anzutake]KAF8330731.1 hypothetical protein EI90DRAFT_3123948 [Cantharellus anzutake]
MLADIISWVKGMITQPSTSSGTATHTASSTNGPDVKTTGKPSGAKLRFGLQIDLPLHTMDPSKDTVSCVLDVPESWTPKHVLLTIAVRTVGFGRLRSGIGDLAWKDLGLSDSEGKSLGGIQVDFGLRLQVTMYIGCKEGSGIKRNKGTLKGDKGS